MTDQRHHPRRDETLAVKLRSAAVPTRYLTARTVNLSASGILLELPPGAGGGARLSVGQLVELGIVDHPRQALLAAARFIPATIVRTTRDGATHRLALRFDAADALPLAA